MKKHNPYLPYRNAEIKCVFEENIPFRFSSEFLSNETPNAFVYEDEKGRLCILPTKGGILVTNLIDIDGKFAINHR